MTAEARNSLYTKDYYRYIDSPPLYAIKTRVLHIILKKAFGEGSKGKEAAALDIGCGSGELVYRLSKTCKYVYGLDYSENALYFSKKTIDRLPDQVQSKICLLCADGTRLPFKDNSLDYIFSVDVFEHMTEAEIKSLIDDMRRVLKENGRFIIYTSPNKEYTEIGYRYWIKPINIIFNPLSKLIFKKELIVLDYPDSDDPRHINLQSVKSLQRLFRNSGFKVRVYTKWLSPQNFIGYVYKIISQLWPITLFYPLRNLFCPFLWVEGKKEIRYFYASKENNK